MAKDEKKKGPKRPMLNTAYLDVLALNYLEKNRGNDGKGLARLLTGSVLGSNTMGEIRSELYAQELARGESMGVEGTPEMPSNYTVKTHALAILHEDFSKASLSEIEKAAKEYAPGFEMNLPKGLDENDEENKGLVGQYKVHALEAIAYARAQALEEEHGMKRFNASTTRLREAYEEAHKPKRELEETA